MPIFMYYSRYIRHTWGIISNPNIFILVQCLIIFCFQEVLIFLFTFKIPINFWGYRVLGIGEPKVRILTEEAMKYKEPYRYFTTVKTFI
jgi:hypothetical protein